MPVVLFSDGCSAQTRNVTLSNTLLHFSKLNNIEIVQKYLAVGPTQMECDSVHANIEHRKKNRESFVPADFVQLIKEVRTVHDPCEVHYLDYKFFKNCSKSITTSRID